MLAVAGDQDARPSQHRHRDRHVDEQHPAPAQVGGQRAAEEQAGHRAEPGHGAVDAQGPGPGRPGGEGGGQQGQRAGRGDRGAASLHDAGGQQRRPGGGEPAGHRGQREHDDPGPEHPQAAEQVAGPAAGQQQAAERERVEAGHPVQVGRGNVQRALHVRQGDVDDRVVEHQHQLRGRDDQQRKAEPAAGRGRRGGRGLSGRWSGFLRVVD